TWIGEVLNGKLDDIGIWNRALTPSEIQSLYNSANGTSVTWSTGDTTSSITVLPTQTTTYYATISNGIHSCVDSVTVRVTPKVFVPDMAVCQGDTINVPIIASSLDSVAAISLALNYNPQAMTYVGYTRLRPDMVSMTSIGTAPGQVRLGWFGLSPLINTGPDTLVYYRFVVNQPGGFNWNTQVQGDCELANLDLNIIDYCFEGGNLILVDTVNIISSSQGPFEVEVGASIPLSVQSTGATSLKWQRWNPQQGVWTNLQNNADYAGAESGTLTYTCNTYQRPFPLFRLQLSNGCRNWYGPAMQVTLKQRITISVGQFTACQGDTVEVPLTVTGARELGAVSLTLGFNPGAVQFVDWMNPAASTQTNIWFSNQVGNEIRLAWFSLISANIPDGNALGTLRIVVTNSTPLTWDLVTPGNCEFADEEAETIPAQFLSGNLTVNSLPTVNLGISSPFICPNAGSAT
ncbi:MAG: cohesin domain-containing protein, partial [Bacteroidota bacterium]